MVDSRWIPPVFPPFRWIPVDSQWNLEPRRWIPSTTRSTSGFPPHTPHFRPGPYNVYLARDPASAPASTPASTPRPSQSLPSAYDTKPSSLSPAGGSPSLDHPISTIYPQTAAPLPRHPPLPPKIFFLPFSAISTSPPANAAQHAHSAITSPLIRHATFPLDTLSRLVIPLSHGDAQRIAEWTGTVSANAYRPFEDHPRGRAARKSG